MIPALVVGCVAVFMILSAAVVLAAIHQGPCDERSPGIGDPD